MTYVAQIGVVPHAMAKTAISNRVERTQRSGSRSTAEDCLFTDPQPDAGGKNFLDALNSDQPEGGNGLREASLAAAKPYQKFQFERHGYFVADRADHGVGGKVVFNRVTGLKDGWGK